MKLNSTPISFSRLLLAGCVAVGFSYAANAQLSNDDCSGAIMLTFGTDSASCVSTAGTTIGATQSNDPTDVCSASWFDDDVWYMFTTPATMPSRVVVQAYYDDTVNPTDIINPGMAIYAGCGAGEMAIRCFSGGDDAIVTEDLMANTTYYVRFWSANTTTPNGGTFEICVFGDNSPCNVGTVSTPGPFWNCPGDLVTITNTGMQAPQFGGIGYRFTPGINAGGGTGGTLTLTGSTESYAFDEDLNGVLSANTLPVFVGQWYVTPVVYYDDEDPTGTICQVSSDSVQVNFLAASDPLCSGVGISEVPLEDRFNIFPNPTADLLTISSTEFSAVDAVRVLSIEGKLIQDFGTVVLGSGNFVMDLSELEGGVYFLQLERYGEQAMKRFVMAR